MLNGHNADTYLVHIFKEPPATVDGFVAMLPWNVAIDTLQSVGQLLKWEAICSACSKCI